MKKPSKDAIILIIFYSLASVGYIFGALFTTWFHLTVHHFDQYRQTITVFLGAIFAGITTITIFYMGKFHDYQREFIKQRGKFDETIQQTKQANERFDFVIDLLNMNIERTKDKSLIEKTKPIIDNLKNQHKTSSERFGKIEELINKISQVNDEFKKFPREAIKSSIIDASPFVVGFVYMTFVNLEPTLGKLYNLLIILAIAIGSFVQSWYTKERQIGLLHKHYEAVTKAVATTNAQKYVHDSMSSELKNISDFIKEGNTPKEDKKE